MPEYNAPGGSGDSSPLTTKGDVYTYDTDNARLGVGSNGQVLTADSSTATGLKWAAASGSGNTLDAAYNQGGSGAGRAIVANNGAVSIDGNTNALAVIGTGPTAIAATIEHNGTNATSPALQVSSGDLNAGTDPVLIVSARTNPLHSLAEVMRVTGEAIVTNNITSPSSTDLVITGADNITMASAAKVNLSPDAGSFVHVDQGQGFVVGDALTGTLGVSSAAIGTAHANANERSLIVGNGNTAVNNALAVGNSCTAEAESIALGHSAVTQPYTGRVLTMASNNNAGGFSANTLVLDAAAQIPGSPTAAIAPGTAGPGSGVGNIYLDSGGVYSGGADYAEMFEWNDGNANSADRRGFFVSLVNGNKIEAGNSNVVGVVSSSPAVIGDAADLSWQGKYEKDEFGGMVYELVDGRYLPKPSSTYNPTQSYTPRRGRKEWAPIGLVGKLYVRSAQALTAGNKCSANSSGYAVSGSDYHILRVIRQPTSSKYGIIEILMK